MEKRQFTRAPIQRDVSFFASSGEAVDVVRAGRAIDISVGGMFIETATPLPFGTNIVVKIAVPGHGAELALPGIVRWARPDGMGLQFGRLGARDTHVIIELARKTEEL